MNGEESFPVSCMSCWPTGCVYLARFCLWGVLRSRMDLGEQLQALIDPVYMSQKLRIFISNFLLSSLNTLILLT